MSNNIEQSYQIAKEKYHALGVDTDSVISRVNEIPISIHSWQGDDVAGFEKNSQSLSGGILATGSYPGKARTADEMRSDLEEVLKCVPGEKRLNLQALHLDTDKNVQRDEIEPEHFSRWVDWSKEHKLGLDICPTCFSHPKSEDGLTLSHPNKDIRDFWIRHVKQSRKIGAHFGKELGKKSMANVWIPDGFKDNPVDLLGPRQRLLEALDESFKEKLNSSHVLDLVESKLFGIGSESYVVGSHEFYLGYAATRNIGLCIDTGHFHPTEKVSQKISSVSLFVKDIFMHISRPVRWDSDHVVILEEELVALFQEIIRQNLEDRVLVGTDFFDASINRVAAWIIGCRNIKKAMLIAALEPTQQLIEHEKKFNFTHRLTYLEELKSLPWQAVWDYYCYKEGISVSFDWYDQIKKYESNVLLKRQ